MTGPSPKPTLYLHLGAHKTATTYLQDRLALNQGRIAAAGRAYWRLDQVRPAIADGTRQMRRFQTRRFAALRSRPTVHDTPFADLAEMLSLDCPAVLSEENLLGKPSEALRGTFYTTLEERLGYIRAIIGSRPVELWLCVRNYAEYLASLYGEALRHGYERTIDDLLADNPSPAGQWPQLVARLHAVFPRARLVLWAYEEFRRLEPMILERLAGVPASELLPLPTGDVRPSPSTEAIRRQSALAPSQNSPQRRLSMARLEFEYPRGADEKPFDPWPRERVVQMHSAYAYDLAAMRALPYVEALTG